MSIVTPISSDNHLIRTIEVSTVALNDLGIEAWYELMVAGTMSQPVICADPGLVFESVVVETQCDRNDG